MNASGRLNTCKSRGSGYEQGDNPEKSGLNRHNDISRHLDMFKFPKDADWLA